MRNTIIIFSIILAILGYFTYQQHQELVRHDQTLSAIIPVIQTSYVVNQELSNLVNNGPVASSTDIINAIYRTDLIIQAELEARK